jgi:hypothetical protein
MWSAVARNPALFAAALTLGAAGCLGDASTPRAISSVAVGGACAHDWECQSGVCIAEVENGAATGWTGGACTAPCASDGACGVGSACAALGGEPWCLASCGHGAACRSGYLCNATDSTCLPDCRNSGFSCGAGYLCGSDGRCAVTPSSLAPLGGPCARNADCRSGYCFTSTLNGAPTGWTGGACADVAPGNGCSAAGAAPVVLAGQVWCVAGCAAAACRPGYLCDPDFQACLPDCRTPGWLCLAGLACNPDGTCAAAASSLEANGALCSSSVQCRSGYCQPGGGATGFPSAFCTAVCGPGLAPCAAGSACAPSQAGNRCFAACSASTDCAAGFLCNPAGTAGPSSVCLPDCRTPGASCGPAPRACNQATGICS